MEIILFSAKVQQCNIVFSVVPVQLKVCFTSLKFAITFLVFVLPLGLYEWKITARPMPTIIFKNILRPFVAETDLQTI